MTTVRSSPITAPLPDSRPRSRRPVANAYTSEHFWPIVIVVGAVVLGNIPYLLHLFDPNPINTLSGLGTVTKSGLLPGSTSVDPNVGFTAQVLGHLSMVDWIHGHVPWWNPYEGLGSPLAGEMQAATFFPPTVFLLLSNGQILSHLTVEIVAGLSTYFLLRRLALGRPAAIAGGIAFGLNGTFAWFSHAPANPVALLPLLLLGVEIASETDRQRNAKAWATIGVALALSLYAGFPETAYINGVLVGIWVVVRAVGLGAVWRHFVLTIAKGVGLGLLLAAPILLAFVDYLPQAYVGAHTGAFAAASLPKGAFSQAFLPYVYGPINAFQANDASGTLMVIWGSVGGYMTFSVLVLGLIGLYGSRLRPLRIALLAWTVLCFGRTYGIEPFQYIVNALPGMGDVAFFRYSSSSSEFALIVLAAFGIDDMARGRVPRRWILLSSIGSLLFLGVIADGSRGELHRLIAAAHHHAWAVASVLWALGIVAVTVVAGLALRTRWRTVVLVAMVAIDSIAMFAIPEFSAPRSATLDTAPISFLQEHLGDSRFYTLQPIQPNYGSYFGLSSLDVNDLPVPKLFVPFITRKLDTNANPLVFNGSARTVPAGPTALEEFIRHIGAFERAGVKYLVVSAGTPAPVLSSGQALQRVFGDGGTEIYELPSPSPMFSTTKRGCTVDVESTNSATVTCQSPQTLVRREVYMNGWSASANGKAVAVQPYDDLFQQIRVPAGTSVVTFTFTPPHLIFGYAAFLIGVACLVAVPLRRRARSRTPQHAKARRRPTNPLD